MHDHALHTAAANPALENWPLILMLFVTGLAGSFTHCAGMCGPFVLSQVEQTLGRTADSRWSRLRGAALVPYHLGRMTTYAVLGALSGAVGSLMLEATGLRWPAAGFLLMAAALFAAQAFGLPLPGTFPGLPFLSKLTARLTRKPRAWHHYALGVFLGFLPCGLIYGVLVAVAGSGDPLAGALAMAGFALGTVPGLVMVGWGGALLGMRRRRFMQRLSKPLLAANAAALVALAIRLAA